MILIGSISLVTWTTAFCSAVMKLNLMDRLRDTDTSCLKKAVLMVEVTSNTISFQKFVFVLLAPTIMLSHTLSSSHLAHYYPVDGSSFSNSTLVGRQLDAGCSSAPCGENAECSPSTDGSFECLCPEGKTGQTCDTGRKETANVSHQCILNFFSIVISSCLYLKMALCLNGYIFRNINWRSIFNIVFGAFNFFLDAWRGNNRKSLSSVMK